ncbi:g2518 [Coccomyxa viridis]|uniref:G2518 protein n=1 Tax=Coccomyxa viridis TaxID=1274662 RepID=A0ABP1FNJ0_9CHLO
MQIPLQRLPGQLGAGHRCVPCAALFRSKARLTPSIRSKLDQGHHAPAPKYKGRTISTRQATVARAKTSAEDDPLNTSPAVSEVARKALAKASDACRRIGWFSFWAQLTLSIISACILLFSVAFTSQNGPAVSLYLTLFGIVAGFVSTFWSFGYTRLARRLRGYLEGGLRRVRKNDVVYTLQNGCWINILGIISTLLGLQATVGLLVAKTLTNATANPFLAGGAGSYNPVLALDVFLVQASTNTLLSHFVSLLSSLWILLQISQKPPVPPESLGAVPARA